MEEFPRIMVNGVSYYQRTCRQCHTIYPSAHRPDCDLISLCNTCAAELHFAQANERARKAGERFRRRKNRGW